VRAALYARVSTIDKEQSPLPQLAEMRAYCEARGWDVEEFHDYASAAKKKRPGFERMMELVREQKFKVVLCRHFDRIGRTVLHLVSLVEEMKARNIGLVSIRHQIDTSTAAGMAFFQMVAVFAEFERAMIRERVLLGMADAKEQLAQGRPTRKGKTRWAGRPRVRADAAELLATRRAGATWGEISEAYGLSVSTAKRLASAAYKTEKTAQKPVQKSGKKVTENKAVKKPDKNG